MAAELAGDAVTVFFSYSHKDEALRDELAKHLTVLERLGSVLKLLAQWKLVQVHLSIGYDSSTSKTSPSG